jgi:hypothetical protein
MGIIVISESFFENSSIGMGFSANDVLSVMEKMWIGM